MTDEKVCPYCGATKSLLTAEAGEKMQYSDSEWYCGSEQRNERVVRSDNCLIREGEQLIKKLDGYLKAERERVEAAQITYTEIRNSTLDEAAERADHYEHREHGAEIATRIRLLKDD